MEMIDKSNLPKLIKQSIIIPMAFFDAVLMLQNIFAILALFFWSEIQAAQAVASWVSHMMNNKMIYDALQRGDPSFRTRVLFKVDTAIRIHLQSCKEKENRVDVNDKILSMEEFQQNVEAYSFSQHIPEILWAKHEPQE